MSNEITIKSPNGLQLGSFNIKEITLYPGEDAKVNDEKYDFN